MVNCPHCGGVIAVMKKAGAGKDELVAVETEDFHEEELASDTGKSVSGLVTLGFEEAESKGAAQVAKGFEPAPPPASFEVASDEEEAAGNDLGRLASAADPTPRQRVDPFAVADRGGYRAQQPVRYPAPRSGTPLAAILVIAGVLVIAIVVGLAYYLQAYPYTELANDAGQIYFKGRISPDEIPQIKERYMKQRQKEEEDFANSIPDNSPPAKPKAPGSQ
jgi:hypothetical protein